MRRDVKLWCPRHWRIFTRSYFGCTWKVYLKLCLQEYTLCWLGAMCTLYTVYMIVYICLSRKIMRAMLCVLCILCICICTVYTSARRGKLCVLCTPWRKASMARPDLNSHLMEGLHCSRIRCEAQHTNLVWAQHTLRATTALPLPLLLPITLALGLPLPLPIMRRV